MSTRVPPGTSVRLDWIAACAPAAARFSRAFALRTTELPLSSTPSRVMSVANVSEIGPSLTFMSAFQAESLTVSVSCAPGMQGTTRAISMRSSQAACFDDGTSKLFSSFMPPFAETRRLALKTEMISAAIATATSSGVREPSFRPIGA